MHTIEFDLASISVEDKQNTQKLIDYINSCGESPILNCLLIDNYVYVKLLKINDTYIVAKIYTFIVELGYKVEIQHMSEYTIFRNNMIIDATTSSFIFEEIEKKQDNITCPIYSFIAFIFLTTIFYVLGTFIDIDF